jgi:16S rRNA (cytosine1402-N4)-methyltransferase
MEIVHTPVLLKECLKMLSPIGEPFERNAFMIDSTLGEGGHTNAFLTEFPSLKICGLDADSVIQARAKERLSSFGDRISFYNGWFNDFYSSYPTNLPKPDLILFDLGISVFHYERSGRGFSFRYDEKLDMRLDTSKDLSAYEVVNSYDEEKLANIIYVYGGEKLSRRIARAIVEARNGGSIVSSKALADLIYSVVPANYRHGPIHPATRTFQAIRIEVNNELGHLRQAFYDAFNVLNCGGKMGVITFHSLEDRIIKNFFRNLGKECVCPPEVPKCICGGTPCAEVLTRKPLEADKEEVSENSPSRSAKLRVVRKIRNATDMHLRGVEI